ncbi:group 1 glycosyl transferase [Rhodanobacter spathiphylli B39]|uniref:Group 1 glycosyl transferase n=1 Tax=Rhodanobacter spathiphylli B39 TaxID=1163407 RepID=I4VVA5_9GAMM|nr:group 1 glycosyl transferase [Rhodanobacter spathiphylli B39]
MIIASFSDSIVRFRGELIAEMINRGVSVHVAAPGLKTGENRRELEGLGAFVHDFRLDRTGLNPFKDTVSFFSLFVLMRSLRPRAVMSYTAKPVIYGSIAAWLARVPRRFALITGLGYAFGDDRSTTAISTVIRLMYRYALAKVSRVFFQNKDDATLFAQLGILSSRLPVTIVNGSGVDLTTFTPHPIRSGPLRFLMIARLLGDKGTREFAAAARVVRRQFPLTEFALVGWIDRNPDSIAQEELNEWVSNGDVEFVGRLEDVRPAIAACSVYVLPSYREGTPRSVLEAMAMGRAIITCDAPGCRETVVDGYNGFLVPVKSVDQLVIAMSRFISEPGLVLSMGARSRLLAEEKYDVKMVNSIMLQGMGIDLEPVNLVECHE